jgi:hypothetical protein
MKKTVALAFGLLLFAGCQKKETPLTAPDTTVKPDSPTISSKPTDSTSSPGDTITSSSAAIKPGNLAALLRQADVKSQPISISAAKDTSITYRQGTVLYIKANSFVNEKTGKPVSGKVTVKVKEYYKLSDMILAGLSTTSDGSLLTTGGMLYVEAFANGQKCKLAPQSAMQISFPGKPDAKMKLYSGASKKDAINWKLQTATDTVKVRLVEETSSGISAWYTAPDLKIILPDNVKNSVAIVKYTIGTNGKVKDAAIVKSINPETDAAILKGFGKLSNLTPAYRDGQAVDITYEVAVAISGGEDSDSKISVNYLRNEQNVTITPTRVDTLVLTGTLLSTSNLGWINCDKIWEGDPEKVNYAINLENSEEARVTVIFHKYKAMLGRSTSEQTLVINSMPKDEEVTLVAIKAIGNQYYIAIKETRISKIDEKLDFEKTSFLEIEKKIKSVDGIAYR